MNTQNTIIGILGGIAVGAIAGILLAPEKGEVTRKKIVNKAKDVKNSLEQNVDTTIEKVSENIKTFKNAGKEIVEKSKVELAKVQQEIAS